MRDRAGTPPHQHAILLHEIANLMRATVGADMMNPRELLTALDSMRGWMARNVVRLLDDSRALNDLSCRATSDDASGEGEGA